LLEELSDEQKIERFLAGVPVAVVGASTKRTKYGNKVLRCLQQNGFAAIPVNPHASEIEGLQVIKSITDANSPIHSVSLITPPDVTDRVIDEIIQVGIQHVWMQPGAESAGSIEKAVDAGINVIAGGPCILVALGFRDEE